MSIDIATEILDQAIQVIIITSMPSVGVGLLVGLLISVFQALTQIQEQTLTFVPKMVVVFLIIALTFSWMSKIILEMTISFWELIPQFSK